MSPVGLVNTRILTGYAQNSPRTLVYTIMPRWQTYNGVFYYRRIAKTCAGVVCTEWQEAVVAASACGWMDG